MTFLTGLAQKSWRYYIQNAKKGQCYCNNKSRIPGHWARHLMTCCLLTQNQIRYKSCLSTDCFAVFKESEAIWIWWIISRGYFVYNSKSRRRRPFIIYLIVFFIIVWIFSNVIIKIREACLSFSDNKEIWWIHFLHCSSFFQSLLLFWVIMDDWFCCTGIQVDCCSSKIRVNNSIFFTC